MTSRVCRALSAFVLFVGAVILLPGSARAAARADSLPVEVGIGLVSPQVPNFSNLSQEMTFGGTLRNTGSTTLRNAHLEIQRSTVNSRSEMGSADGLGNNIEFTKSPMKLPKEIAPNQSVTWKLAPSESDLFGFLTPPNGVYAIDVDVFDADDVFLGGQRTYVVWKPSKVKGAKPARVALMWPVVGQPGLTGQKKADSSGLPILSDPSTAQQFAQNGRLSRILQDAQGLSVNWLVDPDLMYTAQELSKGYFYPDPQNSAKQSGVDGTDPETWYSQASGILGSTQAQNCFNLLYGDPDLNTLSRTTPGQNLLKAAVGVHPPVTTAGCRPGSPTVAWPSDGQADATTLSAVAAAAAAAKVPDPVTLVGSNQVSAWSSAHASLPSSPNTVVYDNYLSSVFTDPAKPAQPSLSKSDVLAGQLWLAQTALADQDNTDRVLVVTPPRDFDPGPALLNAIKASTSVPTEYQWFGLDPLSNVLNTPAKQQHDSALTKVATANLATGVVQDASDSQKLYSALHAIMPPTHAYDPDVPFRPTATWWRNHKGGQAYGQSVYNTVVTDHGLVSFGSQTPPLTMSGKSGTVPVTINNRTNTNIQVYLGTKTSHTVQLKVDPNQGVHTVDPGLSNTIRIPVKVEGNGSKVTLYAKLYTCAEISDDCAYYPSGLFKPLSTDGGETKVDVKVSRIGIIALGLIIGSGMLLILLIGLRVYRAKRTHHAPAQDTMAS